MSPLNSVQTSMMDVESVSAKEDPRTQLRMKQFDEKEEATCIESLTMLRLSKCKTYVLFPLLCLLSCFIYPIIVYWYPRLKASAFFSRESVFLQATHILVVGKDGNIEIVVIERRDKN
jgi:hypothetical protein